MENKIVVISAVWCPSCLLLKKDLKRLNQEYPNLEIELLDYDLDEDEVNKYDVGDKLPVIICNKKRLIGEKKYDDIVEFLDGEGVL